ARLRRARAARRDQLDLHVRRLLQAAELAVPQRPGLPGVALARGAPALRQGDDPRLDEDASSLGAQAQAQPRAGSPLRLRERMDARSPASTRVIAAPLTRPRLRGYAGPMRREQVWKAVSEMLREGFGRLLDVREVRRVRHVAGQAWVATVVLASSSGDLHVADVTVEDDGTMKPALGP